MEIDFFGPVALTKLVLPGMIARGAGHIVAVTSVAGKYGSPVRSGYNAAKHAMHGFFESLWAENARHGIGVSIVVPGSVRTQISVNALTGSGDRYGKMNRMQAQGMPPERVADRVLDAVANNRLEILVADGIAWRLTVAHRWLPFLWRRMIRLR
jgi:short-subunit dehydrogenase